MTKRTAGDEVKALAYNIWAMLPQDRRTVRNVAAELATQGHTIGKSTIDRWAKHWPDTAELTKAALARPPDPPKPPRPPKPASSQVAVAAEPASQPAADSHSQLMQALAEVFDPRLMPLVTSSAIDRMEAMVTDMAAELHKRRNKMADMMLDTGVETISVPGQEGEPPSSVTVQKSQIGRAAFETMQGCVKMVQVLAAARTMPSTAHRNYQEGDRLGAEGRKTAAKASLVEQEASGNAAKDVTGDGAIVDHSEDETGAMAALQSQAREK